MAAPAGVGVRRKRGKFYEELVEGLIDFAEFEFRGSRKLSDGGSEREHSESAARQFARLGRKIKLPAIDEAPPFPEALSYLWRWFCEHSSGLASGGFGVPVVTWEGLAAWCRLLRIEIEPWECHVMVRLGALRAAILSEDLKAKPDAGKNPRR